MRLSIWLSVASAAFVFGCKEEGNGDKDTETEADSGIDTDTTDADAGTFEVGLTTLDLVDTSRDRPLKTNVFYPADESAQPEDLELEGIFIGRTDIDAPLAKDPARFPLVLLSHGAGGSGADLVWLAEYLASRGYIAAAPFHFGNMFGDNSQEGNVAVWRRPPDLSFVLDEILKNPTFGDRIDTEKVGAAGLSSGGYTVIALAGAIYNPDLMEDYCAGLNAGPDCGLGGEVDWSKIEDLDQASASYLDERIRAVFAMAPAVGQGFDAAGLAPVRLPVHIVAGINDELALFSLNAQHYADLIADAQLTLLESGGHFVFMPLCNDIGEQVAPEICLDIDETVDRSAIHDIVQSLALDFFNTRLH